MAPFILPLIALLVIIVVVVAALVAFGVFKSGTGAQQTTIAPQTTTINASANTTTNTTTAATTTVVQSSGSLGAWQQTTRLPFANTSSYTCAAENGYVYCMGGIAVANNASLTGYWNYNVTYAQLTSSGIGPWHNTTQIPYAFALSACIARTGMLICAGGLNKTGSLNIGSEYSQLVAEAPINPDGSLGTWTEWPLLYTAEGVNNCVAGTNANYCIGAQGTYAASRGGPSNVTFSFSSAGSTVLSEPYPFNATDTNCFTAPGSSVIFCTDQLVGVMLPKYPYGVASNASFYGIVSSNGASISWYNTTAFPDEPALVPITCATSPTGGGDYNIYCIAPDSVYPTNKSAVHFGTVTSSGLSQWYNTTSYPLGNAVPESCVTSGGYIYCIGTSPASASSMLFGNESNLTFYAPIKP